MKVEFDNFTKNDFDNIFGIGYHYLLQDEEGIVVEYQNVLYVIWKNSIKNTVIIQEITETDMSEEDKKNLRPGLMIWMHDNVMLN